MAAHEKKQQSNEKLLIERARVLTDMVKKIRSSLVVNRNTAVALESMIPGLLPETMPTASFTEDDSVTNVKPLLQLLSKQFEDVVMELYHVMASRSKDVSEWVQKSAVDMEGLQEAWQAVELITEVQKPASARFVEFMKVVREKDEERFLAVATHHRLFEIAEEAEKLIEAELRNGAVASFTDSDGPQRSSIFEWHELFRNKDQFPEALEDAVEEAEEILFEGDNEDFQVVCQRLDRIREMMGFPITTSQSEVATAFLFMVERGIEETVSKGYSFDSHFTKENFAFDRLFLDNDFADKYVEVAGECQRLFDRMQKEFKVDASEPGQILSIATQISDGWGTVETVFRAQVRLYTELTRSVLNIQKLLAPVMITIDAVAHDLRDIEGLESIAGEIITDCRVFSKALPGTALNDLY